MPLVRVEILKGKPHEYKKALLSAIHDALMLSLDVEDDDRFQRLYELDEDCFERRKAKTDKFTFIELTLLPGRSKELKKRVITEITRLLAERLSIQATDVIIIINEPPLDNWGCYGKQGSELNMKYKLE